MEPAKDPGTIRKKDADVRELHPRTKTPISGLAVMLSSTVSRDTPEKRPDVLRFAVRLADCARSQMSMAVRSRRCDTCPTNDQDRRGHELLDDFRLVHAFPTM